MVTTGAIIWQCSFRTIGLIESGPAVLDTFRYERSLTTPASEISMSGIGGYLQLMLSGRRFIREKVPTRSLLWHNYLARSSGDLMEKTD